MPTTFSVTTICSHRTNITAELVGSRIRVDGVHVPEDKEVRGDAER